MSRDAERPPQKLPAPNEPFIPREVFRGIGALIPEKIAASTMLSMTAKVCYAHLVRRAGKKARCWPSYRDIAKSIGIGERQALRAMKELVKVHLIRPIARRDKTARQTSNEYEFIWGPILRGEGDIYDTLPPDKSDTGRVTHLTPTGVTDMTPLEVSKRNHHQGRNTERNTPRPESAFRVNSTPERSPSPSPNPESDDDDSKRTEYASAKDELKAICQTKTGKSIRVADLDAIESMLTAAGVTWEAFVREVRGHYWDRIENPVGFLKSVAKRFRAKIQASDAPVTAAEARVKNYRCDFCGSRIPGEGARLIEGKSVP